METFYTVILFKSKISFCEPLIYLLSRTESSKCTVTIFYFQRIAHDLKKLIKL